MSSAENTTTNEIFLQDTISSSNHSITDITELYTELSNSKDNPISKYEFYDTKTLKFMKIVVDIDLVEITKKKANELYDDIDVISKTTNVLKKIFGEDINIIHTTDHRRFIKNGEKKPKYKKSYHIIVDNKKINPKLLGDIMRKYKDKFSYKIDTSIYRNGENKFRLPLTIKESGLEKRTSKKISFMVMSLPENADNFKKYCISNTYKLKEVEPLIEIEEEKVDIEEKKKEENVWDFCDLNFDKYNRILDKYKHDKIEKKNNTWVCSLINFDCPFGAKHSSNRRYLTLNFLTNSIYLKCHSKRCEKKMKMILDNVFNELREFNLSIFMRLKSYTYQKKYLEKRVVYLSDTNKYKQIKLDRRNNKYLEDICFLPISSCKTEIADKDGEKESLFGKIYSGDKYKKIYKNTIFYPDARNYDKNYYNEFQGFGYEKILP